MRLLVLSPILPDSPSDGDRLRLFHFLKNLGKRHHVTLLAFGDAATDLKQLEPFVQAAYVLPMPRSRQWFNVLSRVFFATPANVNSYASLAMRDKMDSLLESGNFDAVFCYRLRMAPYALRSKLPRAIDYTDSLTRYGERRAVGAQGLKKIAFKREARKIAAYEAWTVEQFDAGFMNSAQDAATLKAMAPQAAVVTAANGADFEHLSRLNLKRDPNRMVFIGNLAYAPNAQAVLWFAKEVLPLILKKRPKAKFVVVGGQAPGSLKDLTGVEFLGFAKELNPILNSAGISVCPVHLAAGRQNKILDAFATATPVVATSLTATGVEAKIGRELLAADTAEDFAEATLKLMQSPVLARRLGQAGYRFVHKHYDWASSARLIEKALIKS